MCPCRLTDYPKGQRRNRCEGALESMRHDTKKKKKKSEALRKTVWEPALELQDLGTHFRSWMCFLHTVAAKSLTKFKTWVTYLMAGTVRDLLRWSAPKECLAQSPYFQNFLPLAGVRLCSHWEPCQGDSALTAEHRGESPSVCAVKGKSHKRVQWRVPETLCKASRRGQLQLECSGQLPSMGG